ncbi:hypothetical protein IW262DRAFT_1299711 [Armillaria fumosa]|nr:hypothetical protein IW262DRAFT_1299711 [Armillaria fumosa]
MSTPHLPSCIPLRIPADIPYLTTREQVTDLNSQERWAKPLIPAYRTARGHSQAILDAYLNGLFIAYHDRFRCTLGAPSNTQDQASVMRWKQSALDINLKASNSLPLGASQPSDEGKLKTTLKPMLPEPTDSKTAKLPMLQELLGERKHGVAPSVYLRLPLKDRLETISAVTVSTAQNVQAHNSSVSSIVQPTMPLHTALNVKPHDEESLVIIVKYIPLSSFMRKSLKHSRSLSEIPEEENIKVKHLQSVTEEGSPILKEESVC